jgi:ABC-type glycerol-3-phosphate transport system substrate-binding protein
MNKNFQFIVLGVCILIAIVGVISFSVFGKSKGNNQGPQSPILIWGTESGEYMTELISRTSSRLNADFRVTYVQKNRDTFDTELIEELARGSGPDIILVSHDRLIRHQDKIYPISYEYYSERNYKDAFIEATEIFLDRSGILAVPFSVDPMVMYWNRQSFSDAGLAMPPRYWDEFFSTTIPLTRIDTSRNVLRSAVALGEYDNINNAKEILLTLLLQSGTKVTTMRNDRLEVVMGQSTTGGPSPLESTLRFYTEFSNPSKQVYSWNKSLPQAKSAFLAGNLAIYFGFASEASDIVAKNPNLNFDVALMPQVRDASRATFSNVSGFAILNRSLNIADAYSVAVLLSGEDAIRDWTDITILPPVRRKLVSRRPGNASPAVFYDSALIAKSWLDPDRQKSAEVFKRMIDNVTTGRLRIPEAASRAIQELQSTIR